MKKLLISTLSLFFSAFGQTNLELQHVSKFIPKNYFVLQFVQGDINQDGINDAILVLGKNGEDSLSTSEHPLKRKFLLLLGTSNKTNVLVTQNNNMVYYYNYDPNFKDAFVDVSIKKGSFSVNHYGGFAERWGRTSTFTYNPSDKKWYLTKDENSTFDATDVQNTVKEKTLTEKNFGKIPFEKFDIYTLLK
jgi:hypothetical protein